MYLNVCATLKKITYRSFGLFQHIWFVIHTYTLKQYLLHQDSHVKLTRVYTIQEIFLIRKNPYRNNHNVFKVMNLSIIMIMFIENK